MLIDSICEHEDSQVANAVISLLLLNMFHCYENMSGKTAI